MPNTGLSRPEGETRDRVCVVAARASVPAAGRTWEALFAPDLAAALRAAKASRVDALIVDLDLLKADARRVVRRVRAQTRTRALPIIFLTEGRCAAEELLKAGADDCLVKPVDGELLAARVEAALATARRAAPAKPWGPGILRARDGRLVLDLKAFRCRIQAGLDYEDCRLTRRQMEVLALLLGRANQAVRWKDFTARGWRPARLQSGSRTLVQHVMRLRQVLGPLGDRIETVPGVGYRWRD